MDVRIDVDRIDHAAGLDPAVDALGRAVDRGLPKGPVKDALHGTWLGHPLHPLLTDLPIGCFTSATALDLLGGARLAPAAQRLVGAGVLAAVPTAAAGLADWSELDRGSKRAGLVHAAANAVALACYAASWLARRKGHRGRGVLLALAGSGATTVGGYLGGHLSYRRGAGVARTAFEDQPVAWTPVCDASALAERELTRVDAAGAPVLLWRDGERIRALADVCTHLGGPLHEGTVRDGCVVCPWHGSTFRLADGRVERGPAQNPQPAYDARVVDGRVEVRRRAAGMDRAGADPVVTSRA